MMKKNSFTYAPNVKDYSTISQVLPYTVIIDDYSYISFIVDEIIAKLEATGTNTVRHVDCHILVDEGDRCVACKKFRNNLFSLTSRHRREKAAPLSNCTNIRYMNSPEKTKRIQQLQREKHLLQKKVSRLEDKIANHTHVHGVTLSKQLEEDLTSITCAHHCQILKSYPENTFQHIFWKSQMKNGDSRGKRWHPLMIKWSLLLRHQSSHAYEMLRKSGVIQLPSQRTLRDYTYHFSSTAGFSNDLDSQLMEDAKFQSLADHEKIVCLIGDEMHVKEDLIYDKFSGELTSFTNLGDINHHLQQLEEELNTSDSDISSSLATTVFVFMVRGIFCRLNFPYATFPAKSISADQLLPLYIEALFHLERCGFKVIGITLDGYSAN